MLHYKAVQEVSFFFLLESGFIYFSNSAPHTFYLHHILVEEQIDRISEILLIFYLLYFINFSDLKSASQVYFFLYAEKSGLYVYMYVSM